MMMNIRIIKTIEIVTLWSLMIIECRTIRSPYGGHVIIIYMMITICMMITTGSYVAEEAELPWTGNGKRGLFAESIRSTYPCQRDHAASASQAGDSQISCSLPRIGCLPGNQGWSLPCTLIQVWSDNKQGQRTPPVVSFSSQQVCAPDIPVW